MTAPRIRIPLERIEDAVRGKTVGLVTNAKVWLDEAGDDLLGVARRTCRRAVVLCAEHGYRGDGESGTDGSGSSPHESLNAIEIRSLYALDPRRQRDRIADLDLLVLGLPADVGVRHYSFKRTACHVMEMAAACRKPVVLVDFPNPIGGDVVEGNLPDPTYAARRMAMCGVPYSWHAAPVTLRHGMTNGELALMARDYLHLDLDLTVIPVEGWRRTVWGDDPAVRPALSDRGLRFETALGFMCTGLFQGTNLCWGIGTGEAFCVLGAPWVGDDRVLRRLRALDLPGIEFSRAFFIPRWDDPALPMYANQPCNGVRLTFADPRALRAEAVQVNLLVEFQRAYPDRFTMVADEDQFDRRLEDLQWARRIREGDTAEAILREWDVMARRFEEIRRPYLLYP